MFEGYGFRIAVGILVATTILGLGAPWIAPYDPNEQTDPAAARLRPPLTRLHALRLDHGRWMLAETVERRGDTLFLESRGRMRDLAAAEVQNLGDDGLPAETRFFLFGSDEFGRDVFSRWLYGGRISLAIAVLAVALSLTVGLVVGAVAALGGGFLDLVLMRIVDGLLAFPWFFLLIALTAFVPQSLTTLVLILGGTAWMSIARLARGEIQQLKGREFVLAARGLGMSEPRIFVHHVLPNIWTPLAVASTLRIGYLVLAEASLSFLGLGVQPPHASWGNMIAAGRHLLSSAWWVLTFPSLGLAVTVIALHWAGDQARDRLDPRRRVELRPE